MHVIGDALLYIPLGNSEDDPTTMTERGLGLVYPNWGYQGDVNITKGERQAAAAEENQRMFNMWREFWFGSDED